MSPITTLTDAQVEALGDELDELRGRIIMDLGERDAAYIRRVIAARRGLEISGRVLLFARVLPPLWLAGTTALTLSKILHDVEIGHSVMHGQYDWMKDPVLNSVACEWDSARPGDRWCHCHLDAHHTQPAGETRGGWYLRQMPGSGNLTGGRFFDLLGGSLSHQIEHHLFPDLPAHRHAEIATEVRDICERYGLPYNTGSLGRQFGSVLGKITRLALLAGARASSLTAR